MVLDYFLWIWLFGGRKKIPTVIQHGLVLTVACCCLTLLAI